MYILPCGSWQLDSLRACFHMYVHNPHTNSKSYRDHTHQLLRKPTNPIIYQAKCCATLVFLCFSNKLKYDNWCSNSFDSNGGRKHVLPKGNIRTMIKRFSLFNFEVNLPEQLCFVQLQCPFSQVQVLQRCCLESPGL